VTPLPNKLEELEVYLASPLCRQWGPDIILALSRLGAERLGVKVLSFCFLLVTPLAGRCTVFIKLEKPNGRLWPLGILGKSYVVKPYQITSEVINGEARASNRMGITTHR
jgi:hypothetical protein